MNIPYPPPLVPVQQQQNFGSSIFVRRPSPLLKSPSFDSESSDPPNPPFPISCYGNDNYAISRAVTSAGHRQGGTSHIGTNSMADRNSKQLFLASAFRYRTDSETTDDQCIPESLSEEPGHDSALDTTEDIDEEDVDEEEDLNDASPNIDGPKLPQLCLSEAAQSSTESEKTVILDCQLSIATRNPKDSIDNISSLSLMTEHAISSDNIHLDSQSLRSSMLSLPEIVILPGTPSASSPSAPSSPTSTTASSPSSVSIITATEIITKSAGHISQNPFPFPSTTTESCIVGSSVITDAQSTHTNLPFCKANSIPPHVSSILPNSSLEYEQLDTSITYNTRVLSRSLIHFLNRNIIISQFTFV